MFLSELPRVVGELYAVLLILVGVCTGVLLWTVMVAVGDKARLLFSITLPSSVYSSVLSHTQYTSKLWCLYRYEYSSANEYLAYFHSFDLVYASNSVAPVQFTVISSSGYVYFRSCQVHPN